MRTGHLTLLATCALLLTACGSTAVPPTAADPPAATPPISEVVSQAELTAQAPAATPPAQRDDRTLIVLAAPSLAGALEEIATTFEAAAPGARVTLSIGSAVQLVEGAPADVFAAASEQEMGAAVAARRITLPTVTFASSRLTIIVPASSAAGIESLEGLAAPGLRLALAQPGRGDIDRLFEAIATDPAYGVAFRAAVAANITSEEGTARQVVEKVVRGEADAGIVYAVDVAPDVADTLRQIALPEGFSMTATCLIGVVADSPRPEQARTFINFVLSAEGQAILVRWGFDAAPRD